jgi:hypothetical protein
MEQRRSTTWIVLGAMVAFTLIPVFIVVGVLIGASGGDDGVSAPITTTTTAPPTVTTEALADDRPIALQASGYARTMVEQHQPMMDQMRVSATPQMLQLMNSDPMWQMMRSAEYVPLLEEHEANIDQMLARGQ